jgi:hypothetical protein
MTMRMRRRVVAQHVLLDPGVMWKVRLEAVTAQLCDGFDARIEGSIRKHHTVLTVKRGASAARVERSVSKALAFDKAAIKRNPFRVEAAKPLAYDVLDICVPILASGSAPTRRCSGANQT